MKLSRWAAKRARRRYGKLKGTGALKTVTRATMTHLASPRAIPLYALEQNLIKLQSVFLNRIRGRSNETEESGHNPIVRSG